jgi:putative phage-type endonuclease
MSTVDLQQGTAEWYAARVGKVTASRIADVMTKPKRGEKTSRVRANYRAELICEILTGKAEEGFQTYDMKRGIELEPNARAEYELKTGNTIRNVGFIEHPSIPRTGASPDGLIGTEGIIQIKCPKPAIHFDYYKGKVAPVEYQPQMLWEMACTGRKWCDFVSFNERMPDHLQLFIVRFERDEALISEIAAEVIKFTAEIDELIESLPKVPDPLEVSDREIAEIVERAR